MPKVVVTHAKGLVQESGIGMEIDSRLALGVATIAAPAAAAAADATGNKIDSTKTVHVVTNANNANDRIYLPDPATLPDGTTYILIADEAFELCTEGLDISMNDATGVTHATTGAAVKELAVTVDTALMCIRQSASKWRVVLLGDAGAADAV